MKLLIAGGGTGGHVFPALELADALRRGDATGDVRFVGTRAGLEAKVVPARGYALDLIEVGALKRVGVIAALRTIVTLPRALAQSLRIVRSFGPDVVIGVGGYASGPVVLAARLCGRPVALAESNAIPGFTNRLVGRLANVVCVAFAEAGRFFPARKVRVTGNPVRVEIVRAGTETGTGTGTGTRGNAAPAVLIVGGSQGAHAVNELAAEGIVTLRRRDVRLRVVHQTGASDVEAVRARYADAGVDADVRPFIDDMAAAYAGADVVVGRAGATTIAELTVIGRAALLIPFPFAADDHQWHNARPLHDAGAALVFRQADLTGAIVADLLQPLLADAGKRDAMARAMKALGRPDAAEAILAECRRLIG